MAESAAASERQCPVAAMPDELLLHVFALLADGAALLDALPLVCRRWHGLCRDARAWRGVAVRVDMSYDAAGLLVARLQPPEAARVLLHAPALGDLQLQGMDRAVGSALRRCKAVVRRLSVQRAFWEEAGEGPAAAAALDLLWRSRRVVRAVSLWLDDEPVQRDSEQRSALDMLPALPNLEELRIEVSDGLPYAAGQLAAGLPRLRELYVSHVRYTDAYCTEPFEPSVPLVEDLLRGSAASLRSVSLYWNRPLAAAPLAALVRCAALDTLLVNEDALSELRHWPDLRNLTVLLLPAEAGQVGGQVRKALRLCEPHRALRDLILSVIYYIDDDHWEGTSDETEGHVADFNKLRPEVRVQVDGWY